MLKAKLCDDVVLTLWIDESKIGSLVLKVDANIVEESIVT